MLVGILCISMFGGEADGEVRRFFNWWFASSIIVVFMSSIIALPGVVRFTHALFDQLTLASAPHVIQYSKHGRKPAAQGL